MTDTTTKLQYLVRDLESLIYFCQGGVILAE